MYILNLVCLSFQYKSLKVCLEAIEKDPVQIWAEKADGRNEERAQTKNRISLSWVQAPLLHWGKCKYYSDYFWNGSHAIHLYWYFAKLVQST